MSLTRNDVPENRKWKTEHIYATVDEWNKTYAEVEKKIDFSEFAGKLTDAQTLKKCYDKTYDVLLDLSKLGVYAFMKHDEDTRDSLYVGLCQRVDDLEIKFSAATSFIEPELTALDEKTLKGFAQNPLLKDYDYALKSLIKEKAHILSKETEEVLSLGGKVFGGYKEVFGMINNADLPFPTIKVDGKPVKVTHGTYGVLLQSDDRKVRKEAFQKYYAAFKGLINSITSVYAGNVNKNVFLSKARKYESCLDRALSAEDVKPVVYENLLKAVNSALPSLHRYVCDKKKDLGLKTMHMYDMYVPTVKEAELQLDYEDAFKLVKEGLKPLGEEYGKLLQEAHDGGWIDVEETDGKRSGAYSIGVYGLQHPYVLLNYKKTTNNVFTIAHELGHALHTYHSNKYQPQAKADYRIFVAEVASTVNEVLLLKYLLKNSDDKKLKKYLLSYYTDMIKSTLFRQTQFAEFEYAAHTMAEEGKPLTKDALNEVYYNLNKKYYGRSVVSDDEIAYEWARIPHFYNAFYVYKYATGITSAITIAERIYAEGEKAVKDYFKFLSSGGSDSPVELLKLAGVDLTKKEPFKKAMESFKLALDEYEAIEL